MTQHRERATIHDVTVGSHARGRLSPRASRGLLVVSRLVVSSAAVAVVPTALAGQQGVPTAAPSPAPRNGASPADRGCAGPEQQKNGAGKGAPKSTPRPSRVQPRVAASRPAPLPVAETPASVTAVAYRRQTQGERPQSATELLESATREYRETGIARPVVLGPVVAFPYGFSDAVLTCAALRACVIDLEPGERLMTRPIAGDLVRWHVGTAPSGPDGANTLVWVKPTDCDLSTNLVLSTDRRVYQVTLESPACDRTSTNPRVKTPENASASRMTFYFPDTTAPGAAPRAIAAENPRPVSSDTAGVPAGSTEPNASFAARQRGLSANAGVGPALAGITVDITRLNFDYRVKRGKDFPWAPAQVFDDGAHAFIRIPPDAAAHPAPALFEVQGGGVDGKTLLNYTVRDGFYVTDRTFRRAVLVLGQGKHERRVEIENPRFGMPPGETTGVGAGRVGGAGGRKP